MNYLHLVSAQFLYTISSLTLQKTSPREPTDLRASFTDWSSYTELSNLLPMARLLLVSFCWSFSMVMKVFLMSGCSFSVAVWQKCLIWNSEKNQLMSISSKVSIPLFQSRESDSLPSGIDSFPCICMNFYLKNTSFLVPIAQTRKQSNWQASSTQALTCSFQTGQDKSKVRKAAEQFLKNADRMYLLYLRCSWPHSQSWIQYSIMELVNLYMLTSQASVRSGSGSKGLLRMLLMKEVLPEPGEPITAILSLIFFCISIMIHPRTQFRKINCLHGPQDNPVGREKSLTKHDLLKEVHQRIAKRRCTDHQSKPKNEFKKMKSPRTSELKDKENGGKQELQWSKWRMGKVGSCAEKYFQKSRKILENKERKQLEQEFKHLITNGKRQLMEICHIRNSLQMIRKKQAIVEHLHIESEQKVSQYFESFQKQLNNRFTKVKEQIIERVQLLENNVR